MRGFNDKLELDALTDTDSDSELDEPETDPLSELLEADSD